MRRKGATEAAILAALRTENRTQCKPPLADSEVEGIARSIGRYAPAATFNKTDSGNAELLAHLYGDGLRYDHRRGRWLLWRGHSWHGDVDGEISRMALEAARARFLAAADVTDTAEKKAQSAWAIASESRQRREAALVLAQSVQPIADAGENWDIDPWLVGVANGAVDLRTGTVREGRPEDRITLALPWQYMPEARAERWERFIAEICGGNSELIDFIHRAAGYSLTGLTTEQCLFVCYGSGANGKSVFLQTLRTVLGPLATNTAFATLELAARATASNDLAALADRRLVTASETNEGARLNEARVKALTGGDTLTARFLYGEFFEFKPACKLWLAVNHRPRVSDDSEGFWRRVRLIPFTRQFQGADADPNLADTLRAEAEGILAWLARGALAWRERGLAPPECVRAATDEYRAESDPLADFLAECCELGPEHTATPGEINRTYGQWADTQGLRGKERLSANALGRRLGDKFKRDRDGRRGRYYRGLQVRL
jgi:putative DNA primase/helicase